MNLYDVIIIGSGPCGLSCGIEAKKRGLDHLILEKGSIANTIRRYPTNMTFFSTADLLELHNIPFPTVQQSKRPNRSEAMEYYLKVAETEDLNIQQYTEVQSINRTDDGSFNLKTNKGEFNCKKVILAIGYFDNANKLGIPGEELPHVTHFYDEAFKYADTKSLVVGGANSAAETALDLYRHNAKVEMVHRHPELKKSIKYWVKPDIENRIKEGSIPMHWEHEIVAIREGEVDIRSMIDGSQKSIEADFVFLMTGYHPDDDFLKRIGIETDEQIIPSFNEETHETNVPGIYVAGAMVCGCETGNIFIENGRHHANNIFEHIEQVKTAAIPG